MGLVACGPDKPADSGQANASLQPVDSSSTDLPPVRTTADSIMAGRNSPEVGAAAPARVAAAVPPAVKSDMPTPPEGANYTIQCAVFTGDRHIVDATRAKQELVQRTGSREWYILHAEDQSTLYYGFYKTYDDRSQTAEYTRAQTDHARISSLLNAGGDRLFPQAIFAPITLPDPPAPREWDVMQNPGYWTLMILVYRDNPQRKQAAVDMVREFRERYHREDVYFHHYPSHSEVYIGSWPRNAVKEGESDTAQVDNPNQQLLVIGTPIVGAEKRHAVTPEGQDVKIVMPRLVVQDPTLKAALDQFPYEYINGEIVGRPERQNDGTTKVIPFPSCLVGVPHGDDLAGPDNNLGADPAKTAKPADTTPGLGGIR
jgi:hypothetical protein